MDQDQTATIYSASKTLQMTKAVTVVVIGALRVKHICMEESSKIPKS